MSDWLRLAFLAIGWLWLYVGLATLCVLLAALMQRLVDTRRWGLLLMLWLLVLALLVTKWRAFALGHLG